MITNEYRNSSSNNTTNIFYQTNNNNETENANKNPPTSQITIAMNKNTSSNTENKVYETHEESMLLDSSHHIDLDEANKGQQKKLVVDPSQSRGIKI